MIVEGRFHKGSKVEVRKRVDLCMWEDVDDIRLNGIESWGVDPGDVPAHSMATNHTINTLQAECKSGSSVAEDDGGGRNVGVEEGGSINCLEDVFDTIELDRGEDDLIFRGLITYECEGGTLSTDEEGIGSGQLANGAGNSENLELVLTEVVCVGTRETQKERLGDATVGGSKKCTSNSESQHLSSSHKVEARGVEEEGAGGNELDGQGVLDGGGEG